MIIKDTVRGVKECKDVVYNMMHVFQGKGKVATEYFIILWKIWEEGVHYYLRASTPLQRR